MALLVTPDLTAHLVRPGNLDSVALTEHPVCLEPLVPLGYAGGRVRKDFLERLGVMVTKDREEDLDREEPQETADRKEMRVTVEKMVLMASEDCQATVELKVQKVHVDLRAPGEKRVSEVFRDRLVVKGYEGEWDQLVNQGLTAHQVPREKREMRVPREKRVQMDSLACRVHRVIRV